jgi:hypothetical protein
MKKRKRMNKKYSKKLFTRTADRTQKFNLQSQHRIAMRGGIRL